MLYSRRPLGLFPRILFVLALAGSPAFAQDYGLDTRSAIGPYLNNIMPSRNGEFAFPPVLSATGAFSSPVSALIPATGLIPYTVNSPLWSDGAVKTRWFAVPNDGPPYAAGEQISFAPTGEWSFPNGTVFVKHFELTVNEITGEKKRLETRLLVRDADGGVYGVTYKWHADNNDAELVAPIGDHEDIVITGPSGATRVQRWDYPSRGWCQVCHNSPANYVLGVKTHQINDDFTYPSTGRTDNQLRTFLHLGMLNPAPTEAQIPTFLKSVAVTNSTASVQHRMRSWIDANCSQCHRPGGFGGGYDARFGTPLDEQFLIDNLVFFRDLASSDLYQRDNSLDPKNKMPPIAKNVVDENAMANLRQWIASPFEMLSVNLYQDASHLVVRFNSHVDPVSAVVPANYTLDQGLVVSAAALGPDLNTVILTVPSLNQNQTYLLTVTDVMDTAPSANTIWPQSQKSFAAQFEQLPTTARLANISTRLQVGTGDDVLIGGFIMRGPPSKRVLVRALGPSLSAFGITNALADPVLELHDSSGELIATNDSWSDNYNRQEISDAGIAPSSPKEAVILTTLPSSAAGTAYTAIVRGANNGTGTAVVEAYDLDRTDGSKLLNISTRGSVQTGDNVLIAGTIASGPGTKKVLVRAIGPSLSIPGRLQDPTLELRNGNGDLILANDNWRTNQETDIAATQLQPANDLESAILATLPAGNASYTAVVRGAAGSTGIAVVEVYALD